ncbi:MAG: hypothetical protein UR61_C0022G0009, partial [candidate division WS6 bacterium GW2011_GWE1_34_7]
MQLEILNKELLSQVEKTFNISFEDISTGFKKIFEDTSFEYL